MVFVFFFVKIVHKKKKFAGWWCCIPLILALCRQKLVNLREFEASLVYRENFRATQRNLVSKREKKKIKTNKNKKQKTSRGVGGMAKWLGTLPALVEVRCIIPSTHMMTHKHL